MCQSVRFLETVYRDMGVELGCGERLVTEEFHHSAQIRSAIEKMSREGVPDDVRALLLNF